MAVDVGRRCQLPKQVVGVSDIGFGTGKVLLDQPREIVVGVADHLIVPQLPADEVAPTVIGEQLVVGRIGVAGHGRRGKDGPAQPVVAVVAVAGGIDLAVDDMRDLAVRRVEIRRGVRLVRRPQRLANLDELAGGVVAGARDPVGAKAPLRSERTGTAGGWSRLSSVFGKLTP